MFDLMKLFLAAFGCAQLTCLSTKDKFYLSKIDQLLYEKLVDPIPGEGDPVLDSLQIYNQVLNNTIQAFMRDGSGQDVVDILIDQKGPMCIKIAYLVNDTLLQERYDWGFKELGEMYYMLNHTKMLWRDFRLYLVTNMGYSIDPMPPYITTTITSK